MKNYKTFLEGKKVKLVPSGKEVVDIHEKLFDFQKDIVRFSTKKGRSAIFADCGLGKTIMQLEWARQVGGTCLILAPLAVSRQTINEGLKIGLDVIECRSQSDVVTGKVNITNYEKLHKFDASVFDAIVLDESSIIKSFDGKMRNQILSEFKNTPYKLACTATPSPNDYMELGNHAEFLGVMSRTEMLSMFFVHDGKDVSKWKLKKHAQDIFWEWICSWAVYVRNPKDLGYNQDGYDLPELKIHTHLVDVDFIPDGQLFPVDANTLSERRQARKSTIQDRIAVAKNIVTADDRQCLIWCNLNAEADGMESAIGGDQIAGSSPEHWREKILMAFSAGDCKRLITKPSISGYGMNWQNCSKMIFLGLSDSFEDFYQAVRRCWRFGQTKQVEVHIVLSRPEITVLKNIERKRKDHDNMANEMADKTKDILQSELHKTERETVKYETDKKEGENWTLYLGDCVEETKKIKTESIGLSLFSPPFASLYTYSNSDRDMGNSKNRSEFAEHFSFLVDELFRVTMPGRHVVFHCMNLPTSKTHDGFIGISDFRGELIKTFQERGFIYHSEVAIWKDPVIAMQRTKALGLLHKQIKKDSCMSRMGLPDYVIAMRKPGVNPFRVTHTPEDFPVGLWQKWASPIWTDINPSDTLQRKSAREDDDERHICPLQLEVIRRCLHLWSNKGDVVLSPFAGIASEGYEAIKNGRKFIGIELKKSYWEQAWRNLENATQEQKGLFNQIVDDFSCDDSPIASATSLGVRQTVDLQF